MPAKFFKIYGGQLELLRPTPGAFDAGLINTTTPVFLPLPGGLKYRFDSSCHFIGVSPTDRPSFSVFKLKLVKLNNVRVSPSLEATVNVEVLYSDRSLFEKYRERTIKVDNMTDITFDDVFRPLETVEVDETIHCRKMLTGIMFIKCEMVFCDKLRPHIARYTEISSNKYLDFVNNFKSMCEPSVLSDFTFKVGDKTFHVHKFVLAAHSPVLKDMFNEFLEFKTNSVTIKDITPEIFDSFLRYLYSCDIEDKTWDSLKKLYYLAHTYDVGILKNECAQLFISLLSVDMVCDMLNLAYTYSDSHLKTVAKRFVVQHIWEICKKEEWKQLVRTHPIIEKEISDFNSGLLCKILC